MKGSPLDKSLYNYCKKNKIDVGKKMNYGQLFDKLFSVMIEPKLIQPTFVFLIGALFLAENSSKSKKKSKKRHFLTRARVEHARARGHLKNL